MKEMVGGCCVCSDERGWPENPLVYCDGQNCTVAVHQACYGIVTVPTGPWYCRKCESQERSTRVRCELCPSRDGALKKTDNQGWAHVVCALYIPEVRFGNVTTMEPIILQLIPQERYGKTCYICQEMGKANRSTVGACMQCNKSNCKQQFHVTCAQSLGLLCEEAGNYLDNVKYCGYCQHHYGKLKKGGNVKTIPPYKPISRDSSSDSVSSPEKESDGIINSTGTTTSATINIKINSNLGTSLSSSTSSTSSSKQRKSYNTSKQAPLCPTSNSNTNTAGSTNLINSLHNFNTPNSSSSSISSITNASNAGISSSNTNVGFGGSSTNALPGSSSNLNSSTSTTKISSSNSSSYKDKESKHSKNFGKTSTSIKDKEAGYIFTSSRDKCSKASKNKDVTLNTNTTTNANSHNNNNSNNLNITATLAANTIGSSTYASDNNSNVIQTLSPSHSNLSNFGTQNTGSNGSDNINVTNLNSSNGTTTCVKTSSMTSTSFNSVPTNSTGNSQVEANNLISTSSSAENATTSNLQSNSNTSTHTSVSIHSNTSSILSTSTSAFLGKKRKTEARNNTITDAVNGQFRDLIKDVSVTLTQLTDFEKEIEKSSKKQKTELSPPTHQTSGADSNLENSKEATIISSVGLSTTVSNNNSKQSNQEVRVSPVPVTMTTSNQKTTNNSTINTATSSSNSISNKEREDRYATTHAAINIPNNSRNISSNAAQSATNNSSNSGSGVGINNNKTNTNNAPSLYVSVPLSNANVPGINIPTNSTSTLIDHPPSFSTRSSSASQLQQQQQPQHQTGIVINKTYNGTQLDHSAPSVTSKITLPISSSNTSNVMQSPSHHGVIYQSGKSPISTTNNISNNNIVTLATAGANLTATTTESGNLKITYDKQSARSNHIHEQDSVPPRRSRTPDSGVYSSSSQSMFNVSVTSTPGTISNKSLTGSGVGDGLKFSYEPQVSSNSMPATFESNTIKESPPSSPGSETGSVRKRGRKSKEITMTTATASSEPFNQQQQSQQQQSQFAHANSNANIAADIKDVKIFQNCNQTNSNVPATTAATISTNKATTGTPPALNITSATHMLGNQINPNSSVAQKLSDQLIMEIQDHSAYSSEAITPQFVGVPFPGRIRSTTTTTGSASTMGPQTQTTQTGTSPLASMFGSGANGSMPLLQSLEQLLERQWEQGSQFLMEQAQHFDIASLLSCLHQLQTENVRLEEHVASLIARRDHLLAVNARLAIPLNATNTTQSQVTSNNHNNGGNNTVTTNANINATTVGAVAGVAAAANATAVAASASATAPPPPPPPPNLKTSSISGTVNSNLTATALATAASLATAATTSLSQTTSNGRKMLSSSASTASVISVGGVAASNNITNSNIGRLNTNLDNYIDFRKTSTTTLSNVRKTTIINTAQEAQNINNNDDDNSNNIINSQEKMNTAIGIRNAEQMPQNQQKQHQYQHQSYPMHNMMVQTQQLQQQQQQQQQQQHDIQFNNKPSSTVQIVSTHCNPDHISSPIDGRLMGVTNGPTGPNANNDGGNNNNNNNNFYSSNNNENNNNKINNNNNNNKNNNNSNNNNSGHKIREATIERKQLGGKPSCSSCTSGSVSVSVSGSASSNILGGEMPIIQYNKQQNDNNVQINIPTDGNDNTNNNSNKDGDGDGDGYGNGNGNSDGVDDVNGDNQIKQNSNAIDSDMYTKHKNAHSMSTSASKCSSVSTAISIEASPPLLHATNLLNNSSSVYRIMSCNKTQNQNQAQQKRGDNSTLNNS